MAICSPCCINPGWPSGFLKRSARSFLKKFQTTLFEAYGAVMKEKEYVAVPDTLLANTKELKKYLTLSYEYAKTLKPKPTKKKH